MGEENDSGWRIALCDCVVRGRLPIRFRITMTVGRDSASRGGRRLQAGFAGWSGGGGPSGSCKPGIAGWSDLCRVPALLPPQTAAIYEKRPPLRRTLDAYPYSACALRCAACHSEPTPPPVGTACAIALDTKALAPRTASSTASPRAR